jgi:hypothetical protein
MFMNLNYQELSFFSNILYSWDYYVCKYNSHRSYAAGIKKKNPVHCDVNIVLRFRTCGETRELRICHFRLVLLLQNNLWQ